MPLNSKEKGKKGERELSHKLKELFPGSEFKRGVQYKGTPDSPDVIGIEGIHIECKRVQKININEVYQKAREDAGNQVPVIFHRKNHSPWLVTFAMDDFHQFLNLCRGKCL